MDIQKLKRETEASHRSAEGAVALMHTGLGQAEYVQCIQRIYGVVIAWEERAAEVAPEWLRPALCARRRGPLLKQDLEWFGVVEKDAERPTLPEMNDLPSLLGTMYVMEGSTLGGQVIARHVDEVLQLSGGRGSSYFHGHSSQTGPLWKDFCGTLNLRIPDEQTDAVVVSAKAMFSTFETWMQGRAAVDEL